MTLPERIDRDLVAAMKAKEELKLSVLRMMKTALTMKQTETGQKVSEAEEMAVLRTLVKQRRESIEQFSKGGREDLARKEEAEIKIVEAYLPAALGDREIEAEVAAAIAETGAAGPKDFGKVMKAVMAKLAGRNADGKRVSELVRAKLGS